MGIGSPNSTLQLSRDFQCRFTGVQHVLKSLFFDMRAAPPSRFGVGHKPIPQKGSHQKLDWPLIYPWPS